MPPANSPRSGSLDGRVVLVTGAGAGIGACIAEHASAAGAFLLLVGRTRERLEEVARGLGRAPDEVRIVELDLAEPAAVPAAVEAGLRAFGRLDGLVLNAAQVLRGPRLEDTDVADLDKVLRVNLVSVHALLRATLPALRRSRGSIVAVASNLAGRALPGLGWYAASKAALLALVRQVAVENGPEGVRCNAVSPGLVRTPGARAQRDFDTADQGYAARAPLRRIGEAKDVAPLVTFLLSDDSAWITGQDFVIDGGHGVVGV